jgi:hypothetical protein
MLDRGQTPGAADARIESHMWCPNPCHSARSSRGGAGLALVAVLGLASATVAQAGPPGDSITAAICGGHGTVTIPLGRPGEPPGQRRDCPTGCHAMCSRRTAADLLDDGEGD